MSFATRCTACGTIFRVVQDQLRVSEGWVRCGRCAEVFDAREQLFDIDRDAPPFWAGDVEIGTSIPVQNPGSETEFTRPAVMVDDDLQSPAPQSVAVPTASIVGPNPRQEPQWVDATGSATGSAEAGWSMPPYVEPSLGATDVNADADADADAAVISQPPSMYVAGSMTYSAAAGSVASADLPSFMRPSGAAARWERSGVRLTMAALTLLLLLALALQLLIHFRDAIAAAYPQALPSLQALCQTRSCKVQAWRRIEALSVENSALTQVDDQAGGGASNNRYQLTLSLHNKSSVPVATPSMELSLLNPNGAVVLRRVLSPTDFRQDRRNAAPLSAIAAGADAFMHLQLATGAQRISGYSVEIFHP